MRREYSRREIEQKLLHKGFQREQIKSVLDELSGKDWQNDSRFAESYVRRRGNNGFGPVRITYELQQQGIDAETIGAAVQPDSTEWQERLWQVYLKKYSGTAISNNNERAKRIRFLSQRGFSNASIAILLKNTT